MAGLRTHLGQALEEIAARIAALRVTKSTRIADRANQVEGAEKEKFIEHFESFWFTVSAVVNLVQDCLYAVGNLETSKQQVEKKAPEEALVTFEASGSVAANTTVLFDGLYRLIKLVTGLKWIREDDIKREYQELHFVWLLRNNFLVHPKARTPFAFENIGRQTSFPGDERLLPYVVLGPQGFGWFFYYQFQAAKAGINPNVGAEIAALREENKGRFVERGGWDAVAENEQLLSRIKAFGLAPVDQERLAHELGGFFSDVVLPRLEAAIRRAEADQVFIRATH